MGPYNVLMYNQPFIVSVVTKFLTVSDTVFIEEFVKNKFTKKVFSETIKMNDWLSEERVNSADWVD